MKYVVIGSAIVGNKGAAAMLEASLQTISREDAQAEFFLFSLYPKADSDRNTHKNLKIIPTKPLTLGLIVNPLSLVYKILPPLRKLLGHQQHIKALADCDAYLDQSGITFVDGRGKFLIYNLASILPAIFMGRPVVKCSQAMGPFKNKINRTVAKSILPKIKVILARGKQTQLNLDDLKLDNVKLAADYAFSLEVEPSQSKLAEAILKDYGLKPANNDNLVGICPSQVVSQKCQKLNINYAQIMADFIDGVTASGHQVLLFPHSAIKDSNSTHNNDLPVCRDIYKRLKENQKCLFLDRELTPQQLRYIISTLSVCLVSRFHAMVSALAVATPTVVIGWSHKYAEVLDDFGQTEYAVDLSQMNQAKLQSMLTQAMANRQSISQQIKQNLAAVKTSSAQNTSEIIRIAKTI